MNVRWYIINQFIRKSVRKKDSTTAFAKTIGDNKVFISSSINRKRSIKPSADYYLEPLEPLEPLKHQISI